MKLTCGQNKSVNTNKKSEQRKIIFTFFTKSLKHHAIACLKSLKYDKCHLTLAE